MLVLLSDGLTALVQKTRQTIMRAIRQCWLMVAPLYYAGHAYPHRIDWNWSQAPYTRLGMLNRLVSRMPEARYLEIGCDQNLTFNGVDLPTTQKVGVDPVSGGTHRMTSDAFFAQSKARFDIIFIDGDHTYRQVRQDLMNAMACLEPGGCIVLHDLLPSDWVEAHQPRISVGWTGDCWKVAFELIKTPGIDFKIVKADYGLGLVRLKDSLSPPMLVDDGPLLASQGFGYFYEHVDELPLIDWDEAVTWLQQEPVVPPARVQNF